MVITAAIVALCVSAVGIVLGCFRAKSARQAFCERAEIYGTLAHDVIYSPFDVYIDPMARLLLLINFEKDPDEIYVGFEPQVFDDPIHGQGMLVIGWQVDGRVDVYH